MLSGSQKGKLNHSTVPELQGVKLGDQIRVAQGNMGQTWYLDTVNGVDTNDGASPETAFKTLAVAYGKLTANKNEVLVVMSGSNIINEGAFVWDKAYTHLVGACGPQPYGRVRITHSSTEVVAQFTINSAGSIFKNIHWQMGNGDAQNLDCVVLGASAHYNYFENCHFDAPLNATEANVAYNALRLTSGCRSCTFQSCTFGDWSIIATSTTGNLIDFGGQNPGTHFFDCVIYIATTQASMVPVAVPADIGMNAAGYVLFENCKFLATGTGVSVVFTAPTTGKIVLVNPVSVGVTAWAANSSTILIGSYGTANDLNGLGQAVTT